MNISDGRKPPPPHIAKLAEIPAGGGWQGVRGISGHCNGPTHRSSEPRTQSRDLTQAVKHNKNWLMEGKQLYDMISNSACHMMVKNLAWAEIGLITKS